MYPYVLATLAIAVVAYLSYTQGHIDGENKGREQVIEEDLVRLDAQLNLQYDDKSNAMVNNLLVDTPDDNREFERQIINACEMAERG